MTNNTTQLTTNKIIVLLAFLCVAIMTSLFVFRLSHKPAPSMLTPEQGMAFAAPRDIKAFKLHGENTVFTQKQLRDHWTLVFFGFTHCQTICPVAMDKLRQVYIDLHASYPNLQVVFISLDPDRDALIDLAKYAHSFHPDFIGVSGDVREIHKLQSQFGVSAMRMPNVRITDYQLQHTPSIMLVNPQGKWAGILHYSLTSEQFIQAFNTFARSS